MVHSGLMKSLCATHEKYVVMLGTTGEPDDSQQQSLSQGILARSIPTSYWWAQSFETSSGTFILYSGSKKSAILKSASIKRKNKRLSYPIKRASQGSLLYAQTGWGLFAGEVPYLTLFCIPHFSTCKIFHIQDFTLQATSSFLQSALHVRLLHSGSRFPRDGQELHISPHSPALTSTLPLPGILLALRSLTGTEAQRA